MQSATATGQISKRRLWAARFIGTIPVVLILFGAALKLMKPAPVVAGFAQHGLSEHLVIPVGIIELVCSIVYLIPRTCFLGAILLTGLMGGATATNVRVGDPTSIVTVTLGVMIWGALYLRDTRVQALIPFRT